MSKKGRTRGLGTVLHVAVCCQAMLLAGAPARAMEPTRFPIEPQLTMNELPKVCGAFHAAVTKSFHEDAFAVDVWDQPWPGVTPKWIITRRVILLNAVTPFIFVDPIDFDGDGQEEALLLLRSNLLSQEQYQLFRFTSAAAAHEAAANGEKAIARDGTPIQIERSPFLWSMLGVVEIDGQYFLLTPDPHWEDTPTLRLFHLPAQGVPRQICEVNLWRGDAPLGPLAGGPVEAYFDLLARISGGSTGCGTSQASGILSRRVAMLKPRAAWRPWSLHPPANSYQLERWKLDDFLTDWSYDGLYNRRLHRSFADAEAAAVTALAAYYREAFGMPEPDAELEARDIVDQIFRISIRYSDTRRPEPPAAALERAALDGAPLAQIDNILASSVALDGEKPAKDWETPRDPPLMFALEHPEIVHRFLDAGASIDIGNAFGKTALMYAAQFDLVETADLLLKRHANVNARTSDSRSCALSVAIGHRTALMYAAENGSRAMIELLLAHGADASAFDSWKRNVLSYLGRNTTLTAAERSDIETTIRRRMTP